MNPEEDATRRGDRRATVSLLLGLAAIVGTFMVGLAAALVGWRALRTASRSGKRRAWVGIGLGSVFSVLWLAFVADAIHAMFFTSESPSPSDPYAEASEDFRKTPGFEEKLRQRVEGLDASSRQQAYTDLVLEGRRRLKGADARTYAAVRLEALESGDDAQCAALIRPVGFGRSIEWEVVAKQNGEESLRRFLRLKLRMFVAALDQESFEVVSNDEFVTLSGRFMASLSAADQERFRFFNFTGGTEHYRQPDDELCWGTRAMYRFAATSTDPSAARFAEAIIQRVSQTGPRAGMRPE